MEILVRAIGALASVMFVLGLVVIVKQATSPQIQVTLPRGLKSPGLAMEFAKPEEVEGILGQRKDGDSARCTTKSGRVFTPTTVL